MPDLAPPDPFAHARRADGVLAAPMDGETIPMILGHRAVREAARDWQSFSSDAPFRVPIPSEEAVRSVRQLPIEADPPVHTGFRALIKPFFMKPVQPDYVARIDRLIASAIDAAIAAGEIDIVRDFALPIQSRALTYLLAMPEAAAEEWIGWGTHVFRDGQDGAAKGAVLEDYVRRTLAAARGAQSDDFFAALTRMEIDGRPLSDDEMVGIANLTFAGGRDTIITSISRIIGYFADRRDALDRIGPDAKGIAFAVEEFVRVISPLTHIGRVCPVPTQVGPVPVAANGRVSLCWASANYDESVFPEPEHIKLERSPNPHLGFGSGIHNCLGSAQARAILRSLIGQLFRRTSAITIVGETRHYESYAGQRRWVGYDELRVRLKGREI